MSKKTSNKIIGRSLLAFAAILVFFAIVIGNLAKLQIFEFEKNQSEAIKQQTRDKTIAPMRGTIYDATGKVLAQSAPVETIIIAPIYFKDEPEVAQTIATGLSQLLDVPYETVMNKTKNTKSYYEVIKTNVEKETADKVRAFITQNELGNAVDFIDDTKRYYPYSTLAAQLIGFTGTDDYGLQGIEAYYEKYLKGVAGRKVTAKNGVGTEMPFIYENYVDAQDGLDLHLTIDETIQSIVDKYLIQGVAENKAQKGGMALAMDPKTGAILAMSIVDTYDLNAPFTITNEEILKQLDELEGAERSQLLTNTLNGLWRNRIISDGYEPGSTFKILTMAMAIEEQVVSKNATFTCTGSMKVSNYDISCHKKGGHGTQTLSEILQNSCNPGFIQLGSKIGADNFYKYYTAFGLGSVTGIDLAGESSGIRHSLKTLQTDVSSLATASFGQTFKITPLQLVTAVSAVANGGYLMKPYVVASMSDESGNIVDVTEPTVIRQVISAETSEFMCKELEKVVTEGTGKNAYVMGYRIGGKTGTGEKIAENNGEVTSSFIGVAPADDPQIVLLVVLDEPKVDERTGGLTVAPIVQKMMAEILPYMGIEPVFTDEELTSSLVRVPNVVGKTIADAEASLRSAGLMSTLSGTGEVVTEQYPAYKARVPKSSKITLYTEEQPEYETVVVPNLSGYTAGEVNKKLGELGLNVKFVNAANDTSVTAVSQSPAYGETVKVGEVITVEFAKN